MTDEMILAILGGIGWVGAMAGNAAAMWKSYMVGKEATKAVEANTQAADAGHKVTAELAKTSVENQEIIKRFMLEFREMASVDRDASLTAQIDRIWQAREKVFLARHEEVTELLEHLLARSSGKEPPPLRPPAAEAHTIPVMPDLRTGPVQMPGEKSP